MCYLRRDLNCINTGNIIHSLSLHKKKHIHVPTPKGLLRGNVVLIEEEVLFLIPALHADFPLTVVLSFQNVSHGAIEPDDFAISRR